jgi:4-amino-4-deoxy-L-arabinose transferase-like glycosyltransferase
MIEEHAQSTGWRAAGAHYKRALAHGLSWIDLHPIQALVPILLLTALLGVVKLWIDPPSFEFNWENRWWQIALNVARGQGYVSCKPLYFPFCSPANQVTAMREPLPVLLFAFIALLTNESLLAAAASGVIANLLIVIAVYFLGRELADRRAGLLAALLWAGYLAPVRLFYSQVSGDLLAALWITCGMLYYVRARRTGRGLHWLAAGFLFGLAILSRSAVLIVAVALAAGLLLWPTSERASRARSSSNPIRSLALFVLAWVLTISPWLVRNTVVFGRPVIGSTLAGYYLYRQNYMLPTGHYLRFVSGGEFQPVLQEMLAGRTDLRGTENEARMDQVYREEALRIIRTEPIRYVTLSAYRFLMLWFNWKVNEVYGKQNNTVDRLILIQHALLLAAGAIGLLRRYRVAWPLGVGVAAFSLLCMAIMAHIPYIAPVMPLLVVLSAFAFIRV